MPDIHEQQEIHDINYARKLIKECKETQNPYLDIGRCGITDLNYLPELFDCTHLETLILSNIWWDFEKNEYVDSKNIGEKNILSELPEEIGKLTNLRVLIACGELFERRTIDDISPLSNLTSLTQLDLMDNKLTDISPLSNLTSLTVLNLISNNIVEIPEEIFKLNMDINIGLFRQGLSIDDNIESPPIEIIKQGKEAVFDWFAAENRKAFNEVKVILIGDGGAGKTSLLRRLQTGEFDENEAQTDGINIEDIDFSDNKQFKEYDKLHPYKAHFWDFGGQDIINSTHRFFLTKRSIYIVVLNARKDETVESQIQQWVKQVRANGGNSPIIIVANQIDINPGFGFANENQLLEVYPQIVCFLKVSSKFGYNFNILKEILEDTIPRAELVSSEIDVKWIELKDKLLEIIEEKQYLNEETFIDVCNDTGITDENRRKNAISYFNDVGLLLHFDNMMIDYYVLDPLWITYGVYQILTSQCVAEFNGIVPREKLSFILNDEEDKNRKYRATRNVNLHYNKQHGRFLIEALKRFKLCYCTDDNTKFVIPNHLKTTEPKELIETIKKDKESIAFVYKYDYMPSYIIPNLMVKFHRALIDNWRTGFIIKQKQAKALIGSYKNMVTIIACGELHDKKIIMQRVRTYIQDINKKITPEPESLIPLPGINEYINYKELLYYQNKGDRIIEKFKNNKVHEFVINKLLNGIEPINSSDAKLDKIIGITEINREKTDHLIELMNTHITFILGELAINTKLSNDVVRAMKDMLNNEFEVGEALVNSLMDEIDRLVSLSHGKLSKQIEDAYNDLSKTKKLSVKLKGGIPLLSLIGINVEAEYDISQWYREHSADLMKIGYRLPM